MVKLTPTQKEIVLSKIIGIFAIPIALVFDIFHIIYKYVAHVQNVQLHYMVIKRYYGGSVSEFIKTVPYCISSKQFVPGEIIEIVNHSDKNLIGKVGVIESYEKERLCPITAIVENKREVFNVADIKVVTNIKYK